MRRAPRILISAGEASGDRLGAGLARALRRLRPDAELIGMADRLGTLEAGKFADLIVVDGNPLEDISLFELGIERVVLVMKKGKVLKDIMT